MKKAILVFTTFWDADFLIRDKQISFQYKGTTHKLDLNADDNNFETQTVALSTPPVYKFKNIKTMDRIDCLCPTYKILSDYKSNEDWETFTKEYMSLLKTRKEALKEWINSLEPKIYLLCCWENTSKDANCHRKLIYDALSLSKAARKKSFPVYRDGNGDKEILKNN